MWNLSKKQLQISTEMVLHTAEWSSIYYFLPTVACLKYWFYTFLFMDFKMYFETAQIFSSDEA